MTGRRCGCCEGVEPLTPLPTVNRPGLDALRYRVGTHATFFETMVASLSSHRLGELRPLERLTTRDPSDPAIALLDAWAAVADVLTFYQERIANEGYLLTATERRSILELARLVGYRPRPGVAASVYLAFTLEQGYEIEVPVGTPAQSVPDPGELPATFETAEPLPARTSWNAIPARQTHPSFLQPSATFVGTRTFYAHGVVTNLKANDAVLVVCGDERQPYTIQAVTSDAGAGHTVVTYTPFNPVPSNGTSINGSETAVTDATRGPALTRLAAVLDALKKKPSLPPASRLRLARSPQRTYGAAADLGPQLLTHLHPRLEDVLYAAYASAPVAVSPTEPCHVEALRVRAAPFGHNAPQDLVVNEDNVPIRRREWSLAEFAAESPTEEQFRTLSLDATYDKITRGSHVLVDRADRDPILARVEQIRTVSRADYGVAARVTQLVLDRPWLDSDDTSLAVIRGTTVHAQSEELELAEEPIEEDVADDVIELDGLYDGLQAGRWLVVTGKRSDVRGVEGQPVEGVQGSELVMLAGVVHDVRTVEDAAGNVIELPTDTLHTRLILSEPLAYTYARDSVRVNANVVPATHGETHHEVLGSGDGTQAFQQFTLKQPPLTYVAAPTPEGVESTLDVRVNDVRWPGHETLLHLDGNERGYQTKTDDDGNTTVLFGDGTRGTRLPTGVENVTATYRSGIGTSGNVAAGQISVLAARPLGVKDVVNPQRASGGADPENRDQARGNVPLGMLALDRLVSVADYAGFTRVFAGIGKAEAVRLSDGRREIVHLTIAGAHDAPIDEGSDLLRNLLLALNRFGDPNVPLRVALREAVFLVLSARVAVLADHLFTDVEPRVRAALLDAFSFGRRALGQHVLLSEVVSAIQRVEGVDYVDVDLLDGISETEARTPETLAAKLDALAASSGATAPANGADAQPKRHLVIEPARIDPAMTDPALRIRPAQLAYLNPDLPDTLILTDVTS